MATIGLHEKNLELSSPLRLTALLALARNNQQIMDTKTLYDRSLDMDNVITLHRPMKHPEEFGLSPGTRQIIWNHRNPVGRTARARKFWHEL